MWKKHIKTDTKQKEKKAGKKKRNKGVLQYTEISGSVLRDQMTFFHHLPQHQANGSPGKALEAPMFLSMLSSCCYQLNLVGRGLVLSAEEVDVVVAAFWL